MPPGLLIGIFEMATVRQILVTKGSHVESINPNDTVYDAIKKMADKKIGALVVMDGENVVGMITERHYVRHVFLEEKASPNTLIKEIMTTEVIYAQPDLLVEECMAVMIHKHVRHLPVRENDHLVGLVTIGDLARAFIGEQKKTIEQLESYVGH
jgi:CBS domain-containing protein